MHRHTARILYGILGLILGGLTVAHARPLALYDGSTLASITYDTRGGTPLAKAAALLAHDLTALSGRTPQVNQEIAGSGPVVIIGLADSPDIAALLKANNISLKPVCGKWETYGRAEVILPGKGKALLIFGSDVRGTIWGVVDLTREMGVSPWEWWADVKIRKTARIMVAGDLRFSKEPSVKYRGFFINSDNLRKWAAKTFEAERGGIGPKTYTRVFELMWRLKANMLWPAMNPKDPVFNTFPENYEVAKDYAIVRGSSHVEMLLRANSAEWDPKVRGPYNWLVNRQNMIAYWREIVEKYGQYDNLYTVGLRGADDFPMQGADTPEKMADVVSDAIAEQRKILSEVLKKPADQIPQVFTPYKEITPAYNTGRIKLPDDIIINWSEDNFGYIMQLSNEAERARRGGAGIYYHATFWGAPAAYLWLGSTDPTLMWEEMTKAYHFNSRKLWVLNVGSIKPVEFLNEFFLAMAFDIDAFAKPQSVRAYLRSWATRDFGAERAEAITDIMWRYYKLAFDKNPELASFSTTFPESSVQQGKFNILDFGDENARRASAYKFILAEADRLMSAMPEDRKSAFYELVQYTVEAGGAMSLRQLALDKSIIYGLQHRASANVYADEVSAMQERIAAATRRYNEATENGKWKGEIEQYAHSLPNYEPPHVPEWKASGERRCGVQVEGGGYFDDRGWWYPTLPTFIRALGARSYYLDIFTEQAGNADWSAETKVPWIKLSATKGQFSAKSRSFEQRIQVSVDWTKAPASGEGLITVKCSDAMQPVDVHARIAPPFDVKDASFVDSQGVVSMFAAHADTLSVGWRKLEGVGHSEAALQSNLDLKPVNADEPAALAMAPYAIYHFITLPPDRDYSFPNSVFDMVADIRLFSLPTFPISQGGHVRVAVSLDGGRPVVLDFSVDYYAATWRQNVLDNAAMKQIIDVPLSPGQHSLKVYALDPGVTFDRVEIAFKGASQPYGAIPETRIENR